MIRPSWRTILPLALILAGCGATQSAAPPSAPPPSAPAASVAPKPAASTPAPASAAAAKPAATSSGTAKPAASSAAAKPAASGAAAKPAASGLTPAKIAFVAISTTTLPTWIADAKGLFKQQGLNPDVTYIAGSTSAIPALVSGDVQIIEAQAAASVQAQLQGQDTVSLATHVPYADLRMISGKGINSLNDLKGKTIAVTKAGTVSDVVARALLPKYGLTPDKDVKITYVDTQPGQLAAILNGAIEAALVPPPFDLTAKKAGAQVIWDVRPLNFPFPTDGVITTRKFLREHPDVVDMYLKGFVQAVRYAKANPAETKQIISMQTKETDPELLDAAYTTQMNDWADPPTPTVDGIQTLLGLFPGGEGKNPTDFIDAAPLQKAVQELGAT
jgi:NitT/TauT family transport system substrate-binding protein